MESYRLLRDVREKPISAAQPAAAARSAWPPSRPAPSEQPAVAARTVHADSPAPVRAFAETPVATETFWARLRRGLFGAGKPVEGWRY